MLKGMENCFLNFFENLKYTLKTTFNPNRVRGRHYDFQNFERE
jgi:hypothetical protein